MGSALYSLGGFLVPFISVGSFGIILAICLLFVIPKNIENDQENEDSEKEEIEKPTWSMVFKVSQVP